MYEANSVHVYGNYFFSPEIKQTTDFSNAFNSVNHEVMFKEIGSCIPSMAAWMK